eukprot:GHVO01021472.1.p1 GENE.GHVO01021472.1~~GHVO01021472.1.p1  ORF type:complete len:163 (-),score=30.06 GHVO01021472.1:137-592(-)
MQTKKRRECICKDCDQLKLHVAFGLCRKCYQRTYSKKSPLTKITPSTSPPVPSVSPRPPQQHLPKYPVPPPVPPSAITSPPSCTHDPRPPVISPPNVPACTHDRQPPYLIFFSLVYYIYLWLHSMVMKYKSSNVVKGYETTTTARARSVEH